MSQTLAIVIPTFNEAENITKLIREVKNNVGPGDKIIVVDDNSPDGTGQIVQNLRKRITNTYIIHRKGKEGRGSAVIAGFKFARKFNPDYFVEMDADFSHKPEDIPRLLAKIQKGADIVVGSRYLAGAKIINWPPQRRIFSKFANFYARLILNVKISDYTNGFRIYSKAAVDFLLSQKLIAKGYIVLSETAYLLSRNNFSFAEIAITFVNRKRGQSNTTFSEIKNAFLGVLKIRFPEIFNRR